MCSESGLFPIGARWRMTIWARSDQSKPPSRGIQIPEAVVTSWALSGLAFWY
jgi:hypothetical protein